MKRREPFTVIEKSFIDSLLIIHSKIKNLGVKWAVGGDLGESLRSVDVKPDCVEVLTDKEGAHRIFEAMREYTSSEPHLLDQSLPRNAFIKGQDYPVYIRSHYFEFKIDSVKIKIHGDIQFKVDNWDWGDPVEFDPEYVYIVGAKTPVVPLLVKAELYQNLGWTDRLEKVGTALSFLRAGP